MNNNTTYKLLDPKNDYVFHTLFREKNNKLTEAFLSSVLQEDVKIIANLDRHLDISKVSEKFGIMDLNVELSDKTKCNIEMQINEYDGDIERFLYYLANSYARQLKKKALYAEIHRCINIVITNYEIESLKDIDKFMTKWAMMEKETTNKTLTNKFELYIITLPKAVKYYQENKDNKLAHWGMFFANPYSKEVKSIMNENKDIKNISDELDTLNGDYETQRLAEIREKALHDEASALAFATKKGLAEGRAEGKAEGLAEGKAEGLAEGKIDIAKKLLEMNFSLEDICKATGLTKAEVLKLK